MTYALDGYLHMMQDPVRLGAYRAAINATVRPGDVVLDVGSGVGLLTLFALQAGARHVYAVDPNPWVDAVRDVAATNGFSGAVTCLNEDARQLELPSRVDVMVSDVRGPIPHGGIGPPLLEAVRDRHLVADGRMVPLSDTVYVAPVANAVGHARVAGWRAQPGNADYSLLSRLAANAPHVVSLDAASVLAGAQVLTHLDYRSSTSRGDAQVSLEFEIERPGDLTGLGLWFQSELAPGVFLSTDPAGPQTVYRQLQLPLSDRHAVQQGDVVRAGIDVHFTGEFYAWRWNVRIEGAERPPVEEQHSTFRASLFNLEDFRRRSAGYCPALDREGQLEVFALSSMDGHTPLRTIAERLCARFPAQFNDHSAALRYVSELSVRHAER